MMPPARRRKVAMDAKALEAVPLFAGLSRKEREHVARRADDIDVPAGAHLMDQGGSAHEFFVILEGAVEVTKDGDRLTELGPGDFCGEIALVEHGRRSASVVATTPVHAIVMHSRDFAAMQAEIPHVTKKIHEAIRERMARG
jgi:CRP/FNR family cyclic AMP-dependent transcriptional regulator